MRIKKILSIFLTAALMLSLLVLPANAESVENTEIFKVEVEAASAASTPSTSPLIYDKGEVISIKIAASQNTGITGLAMTIDYDEDVLAFIETDSAANDSFIPGAMLFNDASGVINYLAYSETTVRELGVLAELKFTLKSDACSDALTNITVYPFKNNEKNITNGTKVVPFECVDASFAAHDLNDGIVTDPTCLDNGYTTYHCDVCNKDVIGNITEPTGHFPAAEPVVENYVDPTCTVEGSYDKVVYCSVCDEELSRENFTIDALGHTPLEAVEENRVEADCTNNGSYDMVVYCDICDAELSREGFVIDAHGHSPLDAVKENYVAPDCINKGSYDMVVYCDICDAELSRETFIIDALGHDTIPHDSKAPTCTEIGWETYNTCSRCDYTTYVELAALGHDLVAHEAKAPTCTEIGWDSYDSCSRCDYTTYVELSALGHNCEAVWYKDNDEHWHICSVCDDRADVAGHIYNGDYICDECDFGNVNIAEIFPDTQNDAWYSDAVAYAYSRGILMGYQSGEFGVSDGIQRQNFLLMLARYDGVDLTQYSYDCDMSDVTRGSYYEAAVNWGVQNGITTGYTNGTFGVGDKITREQIVTFLYRYAKYKNIDVENVTDTKAKNYPDFNMVSDFSKEAIVWAIDKGVIGGKQGYIAPQGNAQRCEVAQIMYNIFLKDIF